MYVTFLGAGGRGELRRNMVRKDTANPSSCDKVILSISSTGWKQIACRKHGARLRRRAAKSRSWRRYANLESHGRGVVDQSVDVSLATDASRYRE